MQFAAARKARKHRSPEGVIGVSRGRKPAEIDSPCLREPRSGETILLKAH